MCRQIPIYIQDILDIKDGIIIDPCRLLPVISDSVSKGHVSSGTQGRPLHLRGMRAGVTTESSAFGLWPSGLPSKVSSSNLILKNLHVVQRWCVRSIFRLHGRLSVVYAG